MAKAAVKRVVVRRLAPGGDLLEELTKLARDENITLGAITGIGALRGAVVGTVSTTSGQYTTTSLSGDLEMCALEGNVSLKDGAPFVHVHVTVADEQGRCFGGHVMPGCEIFVAEVTIWDLEGPALVREPRAECRGLALWAVENVGTE